MISSESNILANTISLHLDASARILFKKTLWKMRRDDHESVWEVWFHVLISYHYNKKHHTPFALQRIDILCINAKIMPERSLQ
jgi:hypothetical protein